MATKEIVLTPPALLSELSSRVRAASGTENFLITGGNVIDPYIGGDNNLDDVDVTFDTSHPGSFSSIYRNLRADGFVFTEMRPYVVEKTHGVIVTTARKDDLTLDIAFADDPFLTVGPLDVVGMYYDPVTDKVIDRHGCLQSHASGEFRCLPSKDFDHENAYIIASRALAACAKYGASVLAQKSTIINEFNIRKNVGEATDEFSQYARRSFPDKALAAVVKVPPTQRVQMTAEIVASEILNGVCEYTHRSLESIVEDEAAAITLQSLETVAHLRRLVSEQ